MSDQKEPHGSLLQHLADLRDRRHGGAATRAGKEQAFEEAVRLLTPVAQRILAEFDTALLLGGGEISDVTPRRDSHGGLLAGWTLAWERQRAVGIPPVQIIAHYGAGFHHPHLRGGTIAEWPLNVTSERQARDQRPLLEAIVSAEFHNLVYLADYSIVPATTAAPQPA